MPSCQPSHRLVAGAEAGKAVPTLEEWNVLVARLQSCALPITKEDGSRRGLGLFLIGSHVQQTSDQPNARAIFDSASAALRLTAFRPIAANERILI